MSDTNQQRPIAEVVIVASAFGAGAVRQRGHAAWVEAAASAGATGFEVRRELFAQEADASPQALRSLGDVIAACGLWAVYSTPAGLYDNDGTLNAPALTAALTEADALGARWLKLQLGGFAGRADGAAIARVSAGHRARLLVENGQRAQDGSIARFIELFAALDRDAASDALGMTFDIGNWQWPGEAPVDAAHALAGRVEYVHCKSSEGEGARRFPVAPSFDDPLFPALFDILPRIVPRAIEFPLDEGALTDDARRRVAWLAAV